MDKIIEEVLDVEKNVNQIIQNAREKASEIKQNAEKEIAEKLTNARLAAQKEIQQAADRAREDAKAIREKRLAEARKQSSTFITDNKTIIEHCIKDISGLFYTFFITFKDFVLI